MKRTCLALLLCITGVAAPGACDPKPQDQAPDSDPEPLALTLITSKVELFMEYPALVRGDAAKFVSHFTVLATGEPVRSGTLMFEGTAENGGSVNFRADKPARDGLFMPIHTFETPGKYKARFVLESPQVKEVVDLGELVVHADKADAIAASAAPEPDPPGAVHFLMEQQWKIGMLLHAVGERSLVERLHCPGEIAAPLDRSAVISTPIAGRLLAPGGQKLPKLGGVVQADQLLALVEPAAPSLTESAMYAMELRTKAVEVQRDIDDAQAQIQYARREHERLIGLEKQGASSAKEIYEVERDLALAESQLASAVAMRLKYDESAAQLDVFQEAARKPKSDEKRDDPLRVRLTSPIPGLVVSAAHVEGEQLDVHEELFRIVDLDRVWVTCRVSEFDLARLPTKLNAIVVPSAYPDRRIDVLSTGGRMVYFGSIVDSASRTVPLHFEIQNPDGVLRAGMLAEVFLETSSATHVVAIPEQALVMDNGNPIAFVMLEGELFQKRELEIGIRDAGFVEIKKGLVVGERVATRGSYAIKLSAMSGGFGPGHVH